MPMAADPVKILMVVTSQATMGDTSRPTGLWIEELATPWFVFRDAGAQVTIASPKGGRAPTDPTGDAVQPLPATVARFRADPTAMAALAETRVLRDVDRADFDAIFYVGGAGPMWDLVDDADSIALIEAASAAAQPLAFVCHGQAALLNAHATDEQPLVAGRAVTAFSRAEDDMAKLIGIAPFVLEDRLRALGADYRCGAPDMPFVQRDGALLTGQNPASSQPLAEAVLALIGGLAPYPPAIST